MQKPTSYYVALGSNAACAHKLVMTAGGQDVDRAIAADFFQQLWAALDRETLQDHCDARAAFNEAFRVTYRGLPAVPPEAPAPAPKVDTVAIPYPQSMYRNSRIAPAPKYRVNSEGRRVGEHPNTTAAACAAFFNAKAGA